LQNVLTLFISIYINTMDKFQHKYRIPSARLQHWNYGAMGAYFITICCHNHKHFFGKIVETPCLASPLQQAAKPAVNPQPPVPPQPTANPNPNQHMLLNALGDIVQAEWLRTIKLRPDMNLELGNFVVMPNHFHGILIIGNNPYNASQDTQINDTNNFGPQSKNVASIIRGFKSAVTMYAKKSGIEDFAWQARFYDHIIKDAQAFENIQNYIVNNPANWNKDKFYN
jgi:putative transposase